MKHVGLTITKYALAAALGIMAVALRWLLVPFMTNGLFIVLFPPVIVVAFLLGFGPSIATCLVGIVGLQWLLLPPSSAFSGDTFVRTSIVFGSVLLLGYFSQRLQTASDQARRRELALRESNERYRVLNEAVFEGLLIHDRGLILEMNEAFCTATGYTRDELAGRQLLEFLVAPESMAETIRHIHANLEDVYESRFLRKDGVSFLVEIRGKRTVFNGRPARVAAIHNIEERRNYENRLRQSRDRLRLALESAEMGTWDMDLASGLVRWDARARRLFGMAIPELNHAEIVKAVHPEDRERMDRGVRQAVAPDSTGEYESEYRTVWPDGSVHWVLATGQAYFEGEGRARRAIRFLGILQDITERKRVEMELVQQRELFNSIVENIPAMVTISDPELRQTRVNREFTQALGWTEADVANGKIMKKIYHDDSTRGEAKAFMNAALPGAWHDFVLRAKDGSQVESTWSNIRLRNNVQVAIGIDLRSRRQAERSLQRLYESGIVGMVYWTAEGAIREANDKFLAMVGFTREDLRAGRLNWKRMTPPEFFKKDEAAIRELRDMGKCLPYEKEYLRKDGSRVPVLIGSAVVAPAYSEGIALAVDISDRKRAENALHNSIAELRETQTALKEADRRKDEFLAMLAHELRNPLAPIRNAVYLLKLRGPQEGPLATQREMIERQVSHMSRLLDDLLDVSRITRGITSLNRKKVAVAEVIARAVESARPLITSRKHELHLELPDPDLSVNGDLDRLVQVVGNLLTNAAKYTNEGGTIWLSGSCEKKQAVIRVRDNGIGIENGMLRSIFGLFTQANRTLDRSQGGLGIGLTIVRRLVEMHGGQVSASSPGLGKGSEFTVRLPLTPPSPQKTETRSPAAAATVSGCQHRVLVVEDVVDTADSLAGLLQAWGHQALAVYNGAKALEDYRTFQPDVVLLDIGLPGLNGFQLARRLRDLNANLLIMAMSGYGQESDRKQAEEAGIETYFVKPVDLGQLQQRLSS